MGRTLVSNCMVKWVINLFFEPLQLDACLQPSTERRAYHAKGPGHIQKGVVREPRPPSLQNTSSCLAGLCSAPRERVVRHS